MRELDQRGALTAGFDGTTAPTCGYTFDKEELRQTQMIASDTVNPEAAFHLDNGTVYWDLPEPDDRVAHILGQVEQIYSWKAPGPARALRSRTLTGARILLPDAPPPNDQLNARARGSLGSPRE